MDKLEQTAVTANLKISMSVAVDTVNKNQMYTNKAFENGTSARAVLENSLSDKSKADRAQVLSLIEAGSSHDEAVAVYNTDENFQLWLTSFRETLQETV